MSSAAATSWTLTPGSLLNFTAVALNRSPYFSTLRGPAFATTHLRAVSPGCQLNRGKFGVVVNRVVRHRDDNVSNTDDPAGDDPGPQTTLALKEFQYGHMRSFRKQATRFAQLQPFE